MARMIKSAYSLAEWRKAMSNNVTPGGDAITAKVEIEDGHVVTLWQPQISTWNAGLSYAGPIPPEFNGEAGMKVKNGEKYIGIEYVLCAPCVVYEHNGASHRVFVCETGVRTGPHRSERMALSR